MKFISKYIINPFSLAWKRIAFFSLSCFMLACTNDLEEVKQVVGEEFISVERGEDVEILFTEDAIPTIKIIGKTALRFAGVPPDLPYTEFPDGLKLFVYNEEGEVESELTANEGRMADNSDKLEVRGDVLIINEKGEQLQTEELTWNKVDKKIKTDNFVKIFTEDEVIYGTGFEADENFTNYVIFNISGIVKVKDGEM